MQKRFISNTDIAVSPLGLGTVKLGRNQGVKFPSHFELPSDQEIQHLLAVAQELGINLLDTAPAYGTSEERLGQLLQDRQKWVICSKVGEEFIEGQSFFDYSPATMKESVIRSLKRLKTDYLDILLVHSQGEDEYLINEQGVFHTLADLKTEGLIRSFGMSSKTVVGGLLTVEQADVAMVTHNPIYTDEQSVIAHAAKHHKSIFIKKAFASGHLNQLGSEQPIAHALQFIFAEPGVTSVIMGTINPAHLRKNVETFLAICNNQKSG